ncbi:MAG: caspase family protein [Aquificaceae bacterium]|nr:caspase family protein [Aquificaceae bacterium]MDW8434294.1 caspase family protein [Aquificaceae bacterium]
MRQQKEVSGLLGKVVAFLLFFCLFAFSLEQEDREIGNLVDKINEQFRRAGISGGYVQLDEKNRIILAGTYKNYDEFIYSLMLAYLLADKDKVNPIYDTRLAIIKATTPELCLPYAIRGQDCPYGRIGIRKGQTTVKRAGGEKFALVIGVSKFTPPIPPVPGADADARAFAKYLQDRGYKVTLIQNEEANVKRVKEEIEKLYSQITDGDELVVYAASHGAPVDEKGEVGIVLYDSTSVGRECMVNAPSDIHAQAARKMCNIVKNALSIKDHIIDTFADKKVNIVVLLDACYSGDALRSYLGISKPYVVATTQEYERVLRSAPNLGMMLTASSGDRLSWSMPLSGDFLNHLNSFVRGSPRYILVQRDQRSPAFHGVFTAFLLEALAQGKGSLYEAYGTSKDVINRVSHQLCLRFSAGGRDIRIERGSRVECPEGGQNPQIFRVRLEDYNFEKTTRR